MFMKFIKITQKSRKGKLSALSVEMFVVPLRAFYKPKTKDEMKKVLFTMTMVMCSCGELELPEVQPEEDTPTEYQKKFTFTIKGDFANPEFVCGEDANIVLGNEYTSDDISYSQRMSRANTYMTADGAEMTDMWVVDYKDGDIVQSIHQKNTDADWGTPQMSLTLGTHHVLFLASRGSEPSYSNGIVTWSKPLDTFYTDYEVVVVKTSNGNRAVTLNRCATKLTIGIDDAIPAKTSQINISAPKWHDGWNMITGEPVAAQSGLSRTFDIPSSWIGSTGASLSVWSLSPTDEWTTDVTVASFAGTTENAKAEIRDVPLKANRVTTYHGSLYSTTSSNSVQLSTDWLPQYEGIY